ncbi:MAG TPA: trehalose-6-phosphate synthase [Candidatus Angelobacter sp.]|jgi:trehalose 6-phosphate synthase
MNTPKRLTIVSNRLPCVVESANGCMRLEPSSGGLITALTPVLKNKETTWIGWPGPSVEDQEASALLQIASQEHCHLIPVFLTSEEEAKFYYGFSNEIIWPLFHDLQSRCNFDPSYWGIYRSVNRKYAKTVQEQSHRQEYIWVHDYHLLLLAEELRAIGVESTLAYFHHIPFPSPDIFGKLPWRSELLRAMLKYNALGFQTSRDLQNFVRCLRRFVASDVRISSGTKEVSIETKAGTLSAGTFPISIDYHEFVTQASADAITTLADSLRSNIRGSHRLLGVDRLDYTKGIPERLRAFDLLLEKTPDLRHRVTLIQIVVPSREDIPKYRELKEEVERLVTSINGRFTQNGWVPIQYVYRRLDRTELLAYYRAADIALVTPLKDGMNLVAKEFCAAHIDNEGTLILSEFAGAAAQLKHGALLVNPNDMEAVAAAIRRALTFSRQERRLRMRSMRRLIAKENITAWAEAVWKAAANPTENLARAAGMGRPE